MRVTTFGVRKFILFFLIRRKLQEKKIVLYFIKNHLVGNRFNDRLVSAS